MDKSYIRGLFLLILACILMQFFGEFDGNMRSLYCVLEALGYYTGYLHTKVTITLWVLLITAIVVLLYCARKLMWKDKEALNRVLGLIPGCVLAVGAICAYLIIPGTHKLVLQSSGGLNSVILLDRKTWFMPEDTSMESHLVSLYFEVLGSKDEKVPFNLKLVNLNDPSKESSPRFQDATGGSKFVLQIPRDEIPGYIEKSDKYEDLHFKVVIYNETESKDFYLYFDDFGSTIEHFHLKIDTLPFLRM